MLCSIHLLLIALVLNLYFVQQLEMMNFHCLMLLYFVVEPVKKIEIEANFKLAIEAEVGVDFELAVEPDFVFKFVVIESELDFELEQQFEIVLGFAVFVFEPGLESVELVEFVVIEFVVVVL